jgi:hypothetical protein
MSVRGPIFYLKPVHRLLLSEPAVTDRQGIGFGWLQNAWLLHARLKIHRGGINAPSVASTENPRAGSLSWWEAVDKTSNVCLIGVFSVRGAMVRDRMERSTAKILCCFPQQIGHPATLGHRLAMATRLPVASARDTAD